MQNFTSNINRSRSLNASNALITIIFSLFMFGCSSNDDKDSAVPPVTPPVATNYQFELTVTNLTNAQPLSPVAFVMHQGGVIWSIGSSSSDSLEVLSESGDNSAVLAETIIIAGTSGTGVIPPGSSESISLNFSNNLDGKSLSAVTMLINTNDAFTGFTGMDISQMAVGESASRLLPVYDAGTEGNGEMAGTIPGPVDGGEGYNSARDDSNIVSRHTGVVSMDDGLTNSVLTEAHRFDNPAARVTVTRVE